MKRVRVAFLVTMICMVVSSSFAGGGAEPLAPTPGNYSFTTRASEQDGQVQISDPRGVAVVSQLPLSQEASVKAAKECAAGRCIEIVVEREIRPFIPGYEKKKFHEVVRAVVNAANGEVQSMKTELSIGGDISNSTESGFDRGVTVADFFGPWMLDLEDGYSETFKAGGQVRKFEVVGHETVQGHPCFVVNHQFVVGGGRQVGSTLWVDAKKRVLVKAQQGADIMLMDP